MYLKWIFVLFIVGYIEADFRSGTESCSYPRLQNGRARVRQRSRLVKFVCSPRYELVGNKYATCRGSVWDVPLPVCVRSGCHVPQIENGISIPSRQNAWVVFFCLPGHKMVGESTIYCDGLRWNASAPKCVDSSAATPLKCDFEEPDLCGWTQDDLHDFDWKRLNMRTPSSFLYTGPSFDHTYGRKGSGYFMYIESTSRLENDTARLISPIYDRSLAKNGCFVFFYHMFGKTTGGLRVYQKPKVFPLEKLLALQDKSKYTLFEKWGNQGDVWYEAVSPLTDLFDNFQIVIEGIRGSSYTSDIAIDDVAILQGANCSLAAKATAPTKNSDSCAGRCSELSFIDQFDSETEGGCGCTLACIGHENCCTDYFDICMFVGNETNDDSTEVAPQTQKLVATSQKRPETTSTTRSSTTTSTTSTTTSTSSTTTPKPTPSTTNTPRPTTTSTRATTTARTTKIKLPTTTKRAKSTTSKRPTTLTTTQKSVLQTSKATTQKTTTMKISTKTIPSTTITTNIIIDYSMPVYHDAFKDSDENTKKVRKEHDNDDNYTVLDNNKSEGNGAKFAIVAVVIAVSCCALAWLVVAARSSRGRQTLARFRGQVGRDPEVRYLSTDVDDD